MRRADRLSLAGRPIEDEEEVKQVEFIGFDITGGKVEYDITAPQGANTTLRKVPTLWRIKGVVEFHMFLL